ncbi:MAG: hypothetical protein PHV66_05900 [Bacteroidales bacterium]|nr:hypothetical protein [Bacteroidales bacterium]
MKKHMADGDDVPYFFREIMAMITTVTEEEWGSSKDPSVKTKDDTLRNYAKRGLSKKLAQTIVYRLTPEILTERINERNETQRSLLANDLRGYDVTIDADNVADKVAEWMVEIIQTTAGLVQQDALEKQKQQLLAAKLKNKYGEYLLTESAGFCPNCGRELTVSNNGQTQKIYEVGLIDKGAEATPDNLIALCPMCHATYLIDDNKKLCKELQDKKKVLTTHKQSVRLLDDLPLEKGITGVITKVKKLKEKDLVQAAFDPKELKKKIDPAQNFALYLAVNNYVTTYFLKIHEIMISLDKRKVIDYEEVQDQMKAIYRRLKKTNKSKLEIFTEISNKVHRVTLQDDIFCQIVVSYFIQSCEVF